MDYGPEETQPRVKHAYDPEDMQLPLADGVRSWLGSMAYCLTVHDNCRQYPRSPSSSNPEQ